MPYRKQALKNFRVAYLSTFVVLFILATLAQITIQLALHQEQQARQDYVILSHQAVTSQLMQRDDVLLISQDASVRAKALKDMQHDLTVLLANHALIVPIAARRPELKNLGSPPHDSYFMVTDSASQLLTYEHQIPPITQAQRVKEVYPLITKIFYASGTQLDHLVIVLNVLNIETDSYIVLIQRLEIGLYILVLLTLLYELLFVMRPAWIHLQQALSAQEKERKIPAHSERVEVEEG